MKPIPHFSPIKAKVDGHDMMLFVTGKDRLTALLGMIESAQTSLRAFFYIFGDDATAIKVCSALIAARTRGVKVWLLVDGFGTANRPDSVYQPLIDAGVVFCRFYPRWGRRYLLRNHQKIVVADEVRALIGGANIVAHYFSDDPDGASWHDLFLQIDGPAALRLARYFDGLRRWMMSEKTGLRGLIHILSRRSESAGALRWQFNGPFRRLSPLTRSIKHDIDRAQRVDLIQAYFSPSWGMLRKLARVEARGGKVRLITAARSDNTTTIAAARHCYKRLLKGGVDIFEYLPQMLHMKLIIADDAVYIGSANFDMRSLFLNAEIMLRIDDAGFATIMRSFVDTHIPYCDAITRAEHKARSTLFAKFRWFIAYVLVASIDFTVTRGLNFRRN
ncbi:MAG: phosphatidylserine/phosphatidylglycerophosphate/cardiolipin synthase family protein [Chakrabartia sp.]